MKCSLFSYYFNISALLIILLLSDTQSMPDSPIIILGTVLFKAKDSFSQIREC